MAPVDERPRAVLWWTPIGQVGIAREQADVVLPVTDCTWIEAVDVNAVEQRCRASMMQPLIEFAAETTEILVVFAVAQREHAVMQSGERAARCNAHAPCEPSCRIRRLAFAE